MTREGRLKECVDVFHSQHPTKTVILSAFSAMSGSSSFSVNSINQHIYARLDTVYLRLGDLAPLDRFSLAHNGCIFE